MRALTDQVFRLEKGGDRKQLDSVKKELFELKRVQQETLQRSVEVMFQLGQFVQEERLQFQLLGQGRKLEQYRQQME